MLHKEEGTLNNKLSVLRKDHPDAGIPSGNKKGREAFRYDFTEQLQKASKEDKDRYDAMYKKHQTIIQDIETEYMLHKENKVNKVNKK